MMVRTVTQKRPDLNQADRVADCAALETAHIPEKPAKNKALVNHPAPFRPLSVYKIVYEP
jgi:hypothetical protein